MTNISIKSSLLILKWIDGRTFVMVTIHPCRMLAVLCWLACACSITTGLAQQITSVSTDPIKKVQPGWDANDTQFNRFSNSTHSSTPTIPFEASGSTTFTTRQNQTSAQTSATTPPSALAVPNIQSELTAPPKTEEKKYPDYKLTGFFQLDSAFFAQSGESAATLGDIQDGTGFRRARLAATGNVSERGSYMLEFDMAQGQARFVDVWGQFKETPLGTMRIGRFRQPFGMSELTGVRDLPTLERPTAFAFAPFRQTGIMFSDVTPSENATWAVSSFRTLSDNFGNVYGEDGGFGTAERVTFLMADDGDDCGITHVGLGHSFLDPARDQIQIASQDEIFVGQQPNLGPTGLSVLPIVNVPPFVNSGVFNLNHINHFNLEAAKSWGRGLVQSEYRWSNINLPTGNSETVQAGYVTLRYMLTGETIPYNRTAGVFGRVKPNQPVNVSAGNWGAWEVVTQLSTINLNPLFGQPGISGPTRRLLTSTLALNWYWNANAKTQFEWINGSLNDPTLGDSVSNTIAARVQFDF